MAKGLNKIQVGLTFTADTGQAKAQLQDLKNTINSLYSSTAKQSPISNLTPEVNEALTSVAKLKTALEQATNIDTGRLDLSKFSQQLQKGGISLKQYANHLTQLGPTGEKAFMQLAQSIVTAEVPMRRANAALTEMWTTLKNTTRWQISSSILHGFMGSVQSAYGYAKDLNESLNNIRIVTDYNIDQMSRFAVQANKAAKALSATTTEYTDASLIYYQQGLSDAEVKERTDVTIKMANVARQSAEIVSDQMTAVWNNFDDGSKSLEYYADVMTALGAATASSTDEIAQGLEKFSAIAGTVGLSYEYATSALATVTAKTRQSADVVGTAFKTIFARLEGLNLGETLEDGTDLNKYSQALATVGVQIKDASGEMRAMDDILNDLGARWQNLAQDEKIALAQTVAGVRQYNQLIALMDNWGTMQENLNTAYGSAGTLQKQADIYAESWEAARDRVTAATETIYQNLLNDKFFIKLNNGLAEILGLVSDLTKSLGGISGTLGLIGTIAIHVFRNQISNSIAQGIENFRVFTGAAKHATDALREQAIEAVQYFSRGVEVDSASGLESRVMIDQINRSYEIQKISQGITEEKARQLKEMVKIEEQYGKEAIAAQRAKETAITDYTSLLSNAKGKMIDGGASYEESNWGAGLIKSSLTNSKGIKEAIDSKDMETIEKATLKWAESQKKATGELGKLIEKAELSTKELQDLAKAHINQAKTTKQAEVALSDYEKRLQQLDKELKNGGYAVDALSKGLTSGLSSITSFATGLSALNSVWKSLEDPDLSTFDKFITILTSLSFGLPSMIKSFKEFGDGIKFVKEGFSGSLPSMMAYILGLDAETIAQQKSNKEKIEGILIGKAQITADQQQRLSAIASAGAEGLKTAAEDAENKVKAKGIVLTLNDIAVSKIEQMSVKGGTAAKIAHTAAQWALNGAMSPFVALMLAAVAAMLPYVAAVGLLAGTVYLIVKALNAENEALKEAEEREKRAANAAQQVVEEFNNISESLKKIDSGKETLENLEKGTLEWQKALLEVNNEVQKIIDKYPELIAMGAVTSDANGMLGITEAGQEYVTNDMAKKMTAARNASLRAQQNTLQVKTDNAWDDFRSQNNGVLMEKSAQALVDAYKIYGDLLFEENGEIAEQARSKARELMQEQSGFDFEHYYETDTNEELLEFIKSNEILIKQQAENLGQINSIDNQIIQSKLAQYGSQKTLEDTAKLVGDDAEAWAGYQKKGEGNDRSLIYTKDGVEQSFNMNRSKNYEKDNLPEQIQDFMDMQGDNVEYVAQRSGSLVLEIDGEELEFSEDEVYDALGELYSDEGFEQKLRENLITTLNTVVDKINNSSIKEEINKLSIDDLVALDNLKLGLEKTFDNDNQVNNIFNKIVEAYGTTQQDLENLAQDTSYIDYGSAAFQRLAQNAELSGAQMKAAIQELNALGEIESKTAWFNEQAESMDLDAEAATDMQDYAKHLLDVADEIDGISDSLTKDADAAADLAVEITRMNKGVETLADNFEDWNDILKNSSKGSMEYAKAMSGMKKAVADVLDVESDMISNDFINEHSEDIKKAAEGDAEAIDKLRASMDEEIIAKLKLEHPDLTNLDTLDADIKSKLDNVLKDIKVPDIEVGAVLKDEEFLEAANELVETSGMSADEANAYFAGIGYEPLYNQEEIPEANSMSAPNVRTVTTVEGISWAEENMTIGDTELPIKMPQISVKTTSTPLEDTKTPGPMTLTSFSGDGAPPKIRGLRRKATGSQNNYSSTNAGGGSPGKSGGGGSKSKPATKVKRTKKSEVVERYKEINDALDDMADALDKASGYADRLYGTARIKAMKDQAKLMRDEIDLMKKKRDEAKKYLNQDKKALNKTAKEYGISFSYDEKGNITDYTSEITKLYNQLAAAENKMDKMSTKEAQDEYKEKTVQPIQDKIDALTEAIKTYEETRELIEDLDKEIMQNKWEVEDLEFETFEYEIELKIEVDDRDLQYLEYLLGKIEDKAFAASKRISLITQQTDEIISKSTTTREAMNTILGDNLTKADKKLFNAGKIDQINWQSYVNKGTFTEAEIESLKEYADNLLEYNEELFTMQDQVHEELQNSFAEWNEEIEKGIALFDHYDSIVDHLQNITDLTQGLTKYNAELNRTLAETKTQLASDRAASYAVDYENQKAVVDEMRNKIYDANGKKTEWFTSLSKNEQEKWLEDLEVAEESVRQAEENLFASTSDAIQAAIDEFETAFTSSLKEMELALAGEGGFAAWNTELERQQDISERTLKTYQETYELSKLNRQVINSINDTDNIKAKQALLEIQEEIYQYQKDGTEMSQYELDYLQKKYELRLAEIALEEAQNAKSQVRMSRDSEGNWGYIYTADEDKVAEAQQSYEDKLYEITNLTQEYQDQVSANIIQTYQEFNDAMQEIYDRNAEGLYSSEEEFLNAIAEAQAFYQDKLDFQYEQLDIATANSKALYEDDWTSYQFSTNAKIDSNKGFQNSFDTTMAGVATGYQNSEKALSEFSSKVGTVDPKSGTGTGLLGGIAQAYNNMETSVNENLGNIGEALGIADLDLKNFAENAKKYLVDGDTSVQESSKEVYNQIKTDSDEIKKVLIGEDGKSGLLSSVATFSEKWTKELDKIIEKNDKLIESINDLNKKLTEDDNKKKSKDTSKNTSKDTPKNTSKNDNNDDKKKQDEKLASRAASIVTGVHNGTIKNTSSGWRPSAKKAGYTDDEIALALKVINDSKAGSGYNYNYKKALELLGYDTGGYTGEWGKEGKLALLHQKELVLNAGETENFLLAMNVLREITKAITLQSIIPDASKFNFGSKNVIEQDVTIHAEFPNVTDHNEVEMALSNLINTASQYANRK